MSFLDNLGMRAMGVRAPALKSTRAPKGGMSNTSWQTNLEPVYSSYNDEQALERVYAGNVYAYRCVDAIANSIVSCPFRAGDAVSFNYNIDRPLARLLGPAPGSPNPNMTAATLLRHAVASYMLLGKFAWAIERDYAGRIVGLWPLRAQHLHPVFAKSGVKYFKEFRYGIEGEEGFTRYKPDEIVYIWRPSLSDFRLPESPVNVASLNINIQKLIDSFDFNFLKNNGVPANMVTTPPFASDDDRQRFQEQFNAEFGGPRNAGGTIFAERAIEGEGSTEGREEIDVKILGTNQRDAELRALSDKQIMAITVAFGVPLSILGDSSHRTFSNAFQDRRNYWLETLLPKSREIADGINIHLAPLLDPTNRVVGWFDTSGVPELRPEPAIPAAQAVALRDAGIVTEDEIRADIGLPPGKDVGLDKVWEEKKKLAEEMQKQLVEGEQGANGTDNAAGSLAKQAGAEVVPPSKAPVATAPAASRSASEVPSGSVTLRVLDGVLSSSINNMVVEMQQVTTQRAESRRANRDVFDADYWEQRAQVQLGPVLGAMGMTSSNILKFSKHIATEVRSDLNKINTDEWILREARAALLVPKEQVRQALVDIYTGRSTLEVALAGLGVEDDRA